MYDVQLYVWCKVGKGNFPFFVNMKATQLNILISSLFRIPSKEDIMPGGDHFTVGGDRLVENIKPLLFLYFQHQEIFPPAAWRPYPRCCKEPFGDSPVNPNLKTHLSCPGRKCLWNSPSPHLLVWPLEEYCTSATWVMKWLGNEVILPVGNSLLNALPGEG